MSEQRQVVVAESATAAWKPTTFGFDPSSYRFSVAQYLRMVDVAILTKDDKVELLAGHIVQKVQSTPMRAAVTSALLKHLIRQVPDGWFPRTKMAVILEESVPEPYLALARGEIDDYAKRHPNAVETPWIAEVSDETLERDRLDKLPLYAEAGIPVYWIVNVLARCVEVYEQPSGPAASPGYGLTTIYRPGDMVTLEIDGKAVLKVSVDEVFFLNKK